MTYSSLIRNSGQTLTLRRRIAGAKDAHGVATTTIAEILTAIPCLAEEMVGREVLTPAGDRVIGDWTIMLLNDPGILENDILIVLPANRAVSAISAPLGSVLGRAHVWEVTARAGGKA